MTTRYYFSESYELARQRFLNALTPPGFTHEAHIIDARGPAGEDLTIDIGIRAASAAERTVVISSGLHGVEGFFGSAVQLALLDDPEWLDSAKRTSIVMLHALNPFGFAWKRRWNEENVDLNRSFFSSSDERPATLTAFHKIDAVLNPRTPPRRLDLFPLTALWFIARYGFAELNRTLPVGQYDNPLGLFYGGQAPSATQKILEQNMHRWVGPAADVLHLDFHTGLGKSGSYALLPCPQLEAGELAEFRKRFGAGAVEDPATRTCRTLKSTSANSFVSGKFQRRSPTAMVAYPAHGLMAAWVQKIFHSTRYRVLTAEFGTYSSARILQSLIAENQAYHWGRSGRAYAQASNDLLEMFSPSSSKWRAKAIADARKICGQAIMP